MNTVAQPPHRDGKQPGSGRTSSLVPVQAAPIRKRKTALTGKSKEYRQLWRIVDGAVFDALYTHDDYLTDKGRRNARNSINKRVVGNLMGFVSETRGRKGDPVATVRSDAAERVLSEATEGSRTVPQYEAVSKGRGMRNLVSRLLGLFRRKPAPQLLSEDPCLSAQLAMGIR